MADIVENVITCPVQGCDWHFRWGIDSPWPHPDDDAQEEYNSHWHYAHAQAPPPAIITQETWHG